MGFSDFFSRQAGKPSGLFGRLVMSRVFDKGNIILNTMAKELLSVKDGDMILEIGFGTGKIMSELVDTIGRGQIHGADPSDTMIGIARKNNRRGLSGGRVKLWHGVFEEMDSNENFYDSVFSVNTIYFWPKPDLTANKIYSVLKSGGRVILGFEDIAQMKNKSISRDVFRFYSTDDVKDLLTAAGFHKNIYFVSKRQGEMIFHCAVAVK